MNTTENKWFVANDNGDIIGHDMSETEAKLLASEMKSKKIYFIEFYGPSGNGYVSYDNDKCNSLDMAMTFDTEEEAITECKELQKEWKSELRVTFYADESWEAFNGFKKTFYADESRKAFNGVKNKE